MMSTPWSRGLNALTEIIFDTIKYDGGMIDSVHLRPCQGEGILFKLETALFHLCDECTYHSRQTLCFAIS